MLYIINILLLCTLVQAKLPELETKQATDNLKYVSRDGKVTYYQTRSGELALATNYKNFKLLKLKPKTQYHAIISPTKKKVLFTADPKYYSSMSFRKNLDIYLADYSSKQLKKIATGSNPHLHLKDTYFSYYNDMTQEMSFRSTAKDKTLRLKVLNTLSPYFTPKREMITEQEILYTDINAKGEMAIIFYSNIDKKRKTFYKPHTKDTYIDYCKVGSKVYVQEKSLDNQRPFSNIYSIEIYNNQDFKAIKTIYSSSFNDISGVLCTKDSLYFIKTIAYDKDLNSSSTEIAKIKLKDNSITLIKSDQNPTQLVSMDGLILTPLNGKLYLVEGNNKDLINDNIGKRKP